MEQAKLRLTELPETWIRLKLRSTGRFEYLVGLMKNVRRPSCFQLSRKEFEEINSQLFEAVFDPINAALEDAGAKTSDIDEIVLVGGSTRMPRVRRIVGTMFGYVFILYATPRRVNSILFFSRKAPNFGIDPELAVATGVAVQADVLSGGWPLKVAAVELESGLRKRHIYRIKDDKHHIESTKLA